MILAGTSGQPCDTDVQAAARKRQKRWSQPSSTGTRDALSTLTDMQPVHRHPWLQEKTVLETAPGLEVWLDQ